MRRRTTTPVELTDDTRDRDEGSSLILALIVILIGAMMVLPVMNYTMSVLRANRATSGKNVRVEAVKGGLRAALYDPLKLYQACIKGGALNATTLGVPPGLSITSSCTVTGSAFQDVPSEQRFALTTTQVGSNAMIPPPYVAEPERPDLQGTMSPVWCTSMVNAVPAAKVPCGKPYPMNGDGNTSRWLADVDTTSQGAKIFTPFLPPVSNSLAYSGGYDMPGGGCKVPLVSIAMRKPFACSAAISGLSSCSKGSPPVQTTKRCVLTRLGHCLTTAWASATGVWNLPPPRPSTPTNCVSQKRHTALARSFSRPDHRLQPAKRRNTAGVPAFAPSPCSV